MSDLTQSLTDPLDMAVAQAARILLKKPEDINHDVMVFLNAAYEQGWCLVPFNSVAPNTMPMWPKEPVQQAKGPAPAPG